MTRARVCVCQLEMTLARLRKDKGSSQVSQATQGSVAHRIPNVFCIKRLPLIPKRYVPLGCFHKQDEKEEDFYGHDSRCPFVREHIPREDQLG